VDEVDDTAIANLASQMPADMIQLLYSICLHGRADLGLASDEYAALTMVLLRLLAFNGGSAVEPSKKPELSPSLLALAPATVSVPVRIQAEPLLSSKTELPSPLKINTQQAITLELTPLGDVWFELVQKLLANESIAALVRELALQSQLVQQNNATEEAVWTLQIDSALLANPVHADKLQAALQVLRPKVTLRIQLGSVVDTPAKRFAHAAAALQVQAEALILGDETLQQIMREFDGKIVAGSIKPI
jgi:DNA polymerase-3 subunit gamma/tau